MADRCLDPFEQWMVRRNLEYAEAEGLTATLVRLRIQGYDTVAAAVEAACERQVKGDGGGG